MRTRTITKTLALGLAIGLLSAAPTATAGETDTPGKERKHPAITVPTEIDFGAYRVAESAPGRVWLINRSDETLSLTKVTGSCGCIVLRGFEPVELAAHTAFPVDFTYAAPKEEGKGKTKTLKFVFEDHAALKVVLTIASDADASADETRLKTLPTPRGVIAAPGDLAFGEVEVASIVKGEAWLINTDDKPLQIAGAKGDCGCITLMDFTPMTLKPNEARRVSFSVKTPEKAGKQKNTKITFQVAGGEPLTLPISMRAAEERVASSKP